MLKRLSKAKLWRQGVFRSCERLRQLTALFAVLGLYAQLAAAGLCTCGLPSAATSAFPICQTQSRDGATKQAQNENAPTHRHPCPFCTAHCHAAMAAASSVAGVGGVVYAVAARAEPAPFLLPQPARFSLGAPPRGPPVSI